MTCKSSDDDNTEQCHLFIRNVIFLSTNNGSYPVLTLYNAGQNVNCTIAAMVCNLSADIGTQSDKLSRSKQINCGRNMKLAGRENCYLINISVIALPGGPAHGHTKSLVQTPTS